MANEMLTRLIDDMKSAMRFGEKDRLSVLRMLINALKQTHHQRGSDELSMDDEITVLRREVKTRKETIEQAEASGRNDIAEREKAEIVVIEEYLPSMLSGDALITKVRALASEVGYSGPSDKGKFMKAWMAKHRGQADGRDVQDALGQL